MQLAQIITQYRDQLPKDSLLPGHLKALNAIQQCRTPEAGEMLAFCSCCGRIEYFCHSCGHRNCPKCQNYETTLWLERQRKKLLPVDYFMVTLTLPAQLRSFAWKQQKFAFNLLFKTSSQALRQAATNPRFLGGEIVMSGVLHTHSRRLDFHPHVHYIVPAGALRENKGYWFRGSSKYLMPEKMLGQLFKGKFLAALEEEGIAFDKELYHDWVVNCKAMGKGEQALEYLSRYLYRGVITERNILRNQNGQVTFAYTDSQSGERKTRTCQEWTS